MKYIIEGRYVRIKLEPSDFPNGTGTVEFSLPRGHHPDCPWSRPLPPADNTEKVCPGCTCRADALPPRA